MVPQSIKQSPKEFAHKNVARNGKIYATRGRTQSIVTGHPVAVPVNGTSLRGASELIISRDPGPSLSSLSPLLGLG